MKSFNILSVLLCSSILATERGELNNESAIFVRKNKEGDLSEKSKSGLYSSKDYFGDASTFCSTRTDDHSDGITTTLQKTQKNPFSSKALEKIKGTLKKKKLEERHLKRLAKFFSFTQTLEVGEDGLSSKEFQDQIVPLIQEGFFKSLEHSSTSFSLEVFTTLQIRGRVIFAYAPDFRSKIASTFMDLCQKRALNNFLIRSYFGLFRRNPQFLKDEGIQKALSQTLREEGLTTTQEPFLITGEFLKLLSALFPDVSPLGGMERDRDELENLEELLGSSFWQECLSENFVFLSQKPEGLSKIYDYLSLLNQKGFYRICNDSIWSEAFKKVWDSLQTLGNGVFEDIFYKSLKLFNVQKNVLDQEVFTFVQNRLSNAFKQGKLDLKEIQAIFEFMLNHEECLEKPWKETVLKGVQEASQRGAHQSLPLFLSLLKTENKFRTDDEVLKELPILFQSVLLPNVQGEIEGLEVASSFISFLRGGQDVSLNEKWLKIFLKSLVTLCEKGGVLKEEEAARYLVSLIEQSLETCGEPFFPDVFLECFNRVSSKDFQRHSDVLLQDFLHVLEHHPMKIIRRLWAPVLEKAWAELSDLSSLDVVRVLAQKMGLSLPDRVDFKYGSGAYGAEQSIMRVNLDYFSDVLQRLPEVDEDYDFGPIPFEVITDEKQREDVKKQWDRLLPHYRIIVKKCIHFLGVSGLPSRISSEFVLSQEEGALSSYQIEKRWSKFFLRFLGAASAHKEGETCNDGVPGFAVDGLAALDPGGIFYVGDAQYEALLGEQLKDDTQRKKLEAEREVFNVAKSLFFDFEKMENLRIGPKDFKDSLEKTFYESLQVRFRESDALKPYGDIIQRLTQVMYKVHVSGNLKLTHVQKVRNQRVPLELYLPRIIEAYKKDWAGKLPAREELNNLAFQKDLFSRFGGVFCTVHKADINKAWEKILEIFDSFSQKKEKNKEMGGLMSFTSMTSPKQTRGRLNKGVRTLVAIDEAGAVDFKQPGRKNDQEIEMVWLFQRIFGEQEDPFIRSALLEAISVSQMGNSLERSERFCEMLALKLTDKETLAQLTEQYIHKGLGKDPKEILGDSVDGVVQKVLEGLST